MAWHSRVMELLLHSGLFGDVQLVGAKVRASIDDTRFLDIHYDPTTHSYSYAVIDSLLDAPGDKRLFGWDDCPHPAEESMLALASYPHHFQMRMPSGHWRFESSPFVGSLEDDVRAVLVYLREYLESQGGP
jgi:hypothetical protein